MTVDERDVQLIMTLLNNARATNRDVAARIGLSESACLARIRKLEKVGIILSFRAHVAFEKTGLFHAWADVTLVNEKRKTLLAFERLAKAAGEVAAAYLIDGPSHFRLEIVAESYRDWSALAERLTKRRDLIRDLRMVPIYRTCQFNRRS